MKLSLITSSALAVVVLASAFAPLALAGGEPKNVAPFTARTVNHSAAALVRGESKAQLPFTRQVSASEIGSPGRNWTLLALVAGSVVLVIGAGGAALNYMTRSPKASPAL
ncbi:MAG: hypothetical protein ACJ76I_04905 [Gaiellaceae bacterium]